MDGEYFRTFSTIPYETFDGSGQYKIVTDIFKRVRATLEARTDKTIYYVYHVKDKELPEHVAFKYYGAAKYHWVILLMNEIRDPQWCWPLDMKVWEKFIREKYGTYVNDQGETVPTAITKVSHYETKELRAYVTDDNYTKDDIILRAGMRANADFSYSYTTSTNGVWAAADNQSFSTSQCVKEITVYDRETEENDNRRRIILLKKELLSEFVGEFENLVIKRR